VKVKEKMVLTAKKDMELYVDDDFRRDVRVGELLTGSREDDFVAINFSTKGNKVLLFSMEQTQSNFKIS
jgi:hypothetical protein